MGHRARRRKWPRGDDPQPGPGRVGPIPRTRAGLVDRAAPGRRWGGEGVKQHHLPASESADRRAQRCRPTCPAGRPAATTAAPAAARHPRVGDRCGRRRPPGPPGRLEWRGGWTEEGVHKSVRAAAGVAHRGPPGLHEDVQLGDGSVRQPGPAELDHVTDHRTGPRPRCRRPARPSRYRRRPRSRSGGPARRRLGDDRNDVDRLTGSRRWIRSPGRAQPSP